jgi:hypothetical protein
MNTQPAAPAAPAQPQDVLPRIEGWRNKPTWLVDLWFDNEQHLQEERTDMIEDALDSDDPATILATTIEGWLEMTTDQTTASGTFERDLFSWACAYVDRDELAANWLRSYDPDDQ